MKELKIVVLVLAVVAFVLSVANKNVPAACGWFVAIMNIIPRILEMN